MHPKTMKIQGLLPRLLLSLVLLCLPIFAEDVPEALRAGCASAGAGGTDL